MIADVMKLVDEQLESSQREIADVRSILADAVARLIRDRCVRTDDENAPDAGTDTVTALQFQDLSDQLLAHAMHRLDVLRGEVRQVRSGLLSSPAAPATGNWQSMAISVHHNLRAFAQYRKRPVAVAHLEPGPVELF
ncbi:MAG: hypothetical protein ABI790_14845 [Betaproteobacteria bacterium]